MQDKMIVLEGDAVQEISFSEGGLLYGSGKRKEQGKTFTRFSWNGMPFPVDDTHPFVQAFLKGDLKKVTLIKETYQRKTVDANNVETLVPTDTVKFGSFISKSISRKDELEGALHEAKLAAIGAASANLTPEMVSALMSADI